jgi:hypothetical protein
MTLAEALSQVPEASLRVLEVQYGVEILKFLPARPKDILSDLDELRRLSKEMGELSKLLEERVSDWMNLASQQPQRRCTVCHHVLALHKFPNGDLGGRCWNLLDGATDARCDCKGFDGMEEA